MITQIIAEELGVPLEDVRVTAAGTEIPPLDPGTFSSGVTVRAGNAARIAAVSVEKKLFEFARSSRPQRKNRVQRKLGSLELALFA